MATDVQPKLLTAEEFMEMDLGEGTFELVRGEVVELPPTRSKHGRVCVKILFALESFGRRTGFGYTLANDSAVQTERGPDTVRGADVCFYSHARWPESKLGDDIPAVPPDVAVEVLSPGNRPVEIAAKVAEYLTAGVFVVLIADPKRRTVAIYRRGDQSPVVLGDSKLIENMPELPGFVCMVSDFFV
jgi:Uma2 family endonuclease